MKFIKQSVIIFAITMIGEWLNYMLPLPVPSGVYGLFILLICLCAGVIKLEQVEETGSFLLEIMPVMFIPVSVGLMGSVDAVKSIAVPLIVISMLSTIIVMIITGKVTEKVMNEKNKKGGAQI